MRNEIPYTDAQIEHIFLVAFHVKLTVDDLVFTRDSSIDPATEDSSTYGALWLNSTDEKPLRTGTVRTKTTDGKPHKLQMVDFGPVRAISGVVSPH